MTPRPHTDTDQPATAPRRPAHTAAVVRFLRGQVYARRTALLSVHDPAGGRWSDDLLVVVLDRAMALETKPALGALFDLAADLGAPTAHDMVRGRVRWELLDRPAAGLVKLHLELTEPVDLDAGIVLLADREADNLHQATGNRFVALTWNDNYLLYGDPTTTTRALDRCLVLACEPVPALADLARDH
jgi:hypothetical protein